MRLALARRPFFNLKHHMDWLKKVVKVEATTAVPLNIRGTFSKFGEMYVTPSHHKVLLL
jgi:hypothetical protein